MERRRTGVTNEVENEGKHAIVLSSMHFWGGLISVFFFFCFLSIPNHRPTNYIAYTCEWLIMGRRWSRLVGRGWSSSVSFVRGLHVAPVIHCSKSSAELNLIVR